MKNTIAVTALLATGRAYSGTTGAYTGTTVSGVVEPAQPTLDVSSDSLLETYTKEGAFIPPRFGEAVEAFDMEEPTIDAECYQAQVDIYSD